MSNLMLFSRSRKKRADESTPAEKAKRFFLGRR
jgi:hypothetical protein